MSEFALVAVVAEADSGIFFAKLSFVLEWVGSQEWVEVLFVIFFLTAITLS